MKKQHNIQHATFRVYGVDVDGVGVVIGVGRRRWREKSVTMYESRG